MIYTIPVSRNPKNLGKGLIVTPAWSDPLVIAVPARHPLLVHGEIPLEDVLRYPLVLCASDACEGCSQQIAKVLGASERKPMVAEQVMTHELTMTLVAAGYGLGFATASQIAVFRHPEIVARPLAGHTPVLTTYLLRRDVEPSEQLERFIDRVDPADK